MYLSIIILPLLGSIVSGFFGRKVGVRGAQIITCSCVIVTTILALLAFVEVGFNNIPVTINLFRWIDSEWFNIIWGFQFDALTVSMLIPVLIISSLVHIYSIGYMSGDPHQQRFFSYLSLFTFMMIVLVTGNNYLLMFVGWEGVGVCSYLLVCFWFTRIAANQSSISALLTNRVGDCILTIGMFAVLWSLGKIITILFILVVVLIFIYYYIRYYNNKVNLLVGGKSYNSYCKGQRRNYSKFYRPLPNNYRSIQTKFLGYNWLDNSKNSLLIFPSINKDTFKYEIKNFLSLLIVDTTRWVKIEVFAFTSIWDDRYNNLTYFSGSDIVYQFNKFNNLNLYKPKYHIEGKCLIGYSCLTVIDIKGGECGNFKDLFSKLLLERISTINKNNRGKIFINANKGYTVIRVSIM